MPVAQHLRIFLNYRRDETSGHAGRLFDVLAARFGNDHVFMDIDRIEPGLDFADVISEAVASCDVFIALIGSRWLTSADAKGRPRLENPEDFIRLELEAALELDVRLIPALVQNAQMPSSDELPETLRPFARRHAVELSDTRWTFDIGKLIETLERLETGLAERETAEREAQERAEAEAQAQAERETAEREAQERAEAEAQAQAEREAQEREAQERAEAEAQAQAEREAQEREAQERAEEEAGAEAEREAQEREAQEREAQERAEAEAQAQAEREAQEREAQERAEAEAQAQAEREAQEREEQERAEAQAQAERETAERAEAEAQELTPAFDEASSPKVLPNTEPAQEPEVAHSDARPKPMPVDRPGAVRPSWAAKLFARLDPRGGLSWPARLGRVIALTAVLIIFIVLAAQTQGWIFVPILVLLAVYAVLRRRRGQAK